MPRKHLVIAYLVKLHGARVDARVGGIDAVYVLRKEYRVGMYLRRAQHRRGIGGEKRRAAAARKQDYLALLHVFDALSRVVPLADALNVNRAVLDAAPEVAAADDDANLDAHLRALFDRRADLRHKVEIEAGMLLSGESLSAYLEYDALVNRIHIASPLYIKYAHYHDADNDREDAQIMLLR